MDRTAEFKAMDTDERYGRLVAMTGDLVRVIEGKRTQPEDNARLVADTKALLAVIAGESATLMQRINARHTARHRAGAGGTLNYDTLVAYDKAQGRR